MIHKLIPGIFLAFGADIAVAVLAIAHTNPTMFGSIFPLTYFPYMGFKLLGDYWYLFGCALLGFAIPYCDTNPWNA